MYVTTGSCKRLDQIVSAAVSTWQDHRITKTISHNMKTNGFTPSLRKRANASDQVSIQNLCDSMLWLHKSEIELKFSFTEQDI